MDRFSRILIATLTGAVLLGGAAGAAMAQGFDDIIKERQANFKANGGGMKQIQRAIGSGDLATIESEAGKIAAWAAQMADYFPAGSHEGKTDAREEIWEDFPRFIQYASENETAARELMQLAAAGDTGGLAGGLGKLGATCKTCHTAFKY